MKRKSYVSYYDDHVVIKKNGKWCGTRKAEYLRQKHTILPLEEFLKYLEK